MKNLNYTQLFTEAHKIARTLEGNYKACFSEALKIAWKNAKKNKEVKNLQEIEKEIEKAVENDNDAFVVAVRKSDNYESSILSVLGDTDTVENYMNILIKEKTKLENISHWEILGYKIQIED